MKIEWLISYYGPQWFPLVITQHLKKTYVLIQKRDSARTVSDGQTQATTIPGGQNWPRVKTSLVKAHLGTSVKHNQKCSTICGRSRVFSSIHYFPISIYAAANALTNDRTWSMLPWNIIHSSIGIPSCLFTASCVTMTIYMCNVILGLHNHTDFGNTMIRATGELIQTPQGNIFGFTICYNEWNTFSWTQLWLFLI